MYPMFYSAGDLLATGTPKVHVNQKNTGSVNASQDILNLDGIRSLVEKLKSDMYYSCFIYFLTYIFLTSSIRVLKVLTLLTSDLVFCPKGLKRIPKQKREAV